MHAGFLQIATDPAVNVDRRVVVVVVMMIIVMVMTAHRLDPAHLSLELHTFFRGAAYTWMHQILCHGRILLLCVFAHEILVVQLFADKLTFPLVHTFPLKIATEQLLEPLRM